MTDVSMEAEDPNGSAAPRLADQDELLFRQVHPSWIDDGQPSSQAFRPTSKDEGRLSVARGGLCTAEQVFQHHVERLGLRSSGTWGVTVGETATVDLTAYKDPLPDQPAHSFIDFRGLGRKAAETKSKLLRAQASARGRLHP